MPNISSPHLNAVLWSVGLTVLAYLALVIFWKRRSLSIDTVLHGIDQISVAVGKTGAWAIVILTFAMCYEVFSRYLLQAPTEWAFDMSYILYGVLFMLAGPMPCLATGMCGVTSSTGNGPCAGRRRSTWCSTSSSSSPAFSRSAMRVMVLRPFPG